MPERVSETHRSNVTCWWIEVFGPSTYTDGLRGYEGMLAHHGGLAITPGQRLRCGTLLGIAVADASLPDDLEVRAAFIGSVEWGTRRAMHNLQPGAEVTAHAPVPRRGWGVAPPYQPRQDSDEST
jgi:hemoglobin